ncbi:MAG: S1C family serine protease [Acidimicrobiia bacterium]|nr:S1C family serine protease [Acidimicrobiia bacterium]
MPDEPSTNPTSPDPFGDGSHETPPPLPPEAIQQDRDRMASPAVPTSGKGSHRHPAETGKWKKLGRWLAAFLLLGVGTSVAVWQLGRPIPVQSRTSVTTSTSTTTATTIPLALPAFTVTIEVIGDADPTVGQGSGTVIGDGEYILTNAHVVRDAITITVTTSDGATQPADLVGIDVVTDLAVLRITDPLTPMGEPSPDVLSIGSSVTIPGERPGGATVIGVAQRLDITDVWRLYDLIEIDQPTPLDRSGGPLLDSNQQVVGIIIAVSDTAGPGFAIPIATGLTIAGELIRTDRSVTGISAFRDLTPSSAGLKSSHSPQDPHSGRPAPAKVIASSQSTMSSWLPQATW